MNPLIDRRSSGALALLLVISTGVAAVALVSVIAARARVPGWETVASELLLVFVLGLEGIIAYAAFFREDISAQERRQRTLDFYGRFLLSILEASRKNNLAHS